MAQSVALLTPAGVPLWTNELPSTTFSSKRASLSTGAQPQGAITAGVFDYSYSCSRRLLLTAVVDRSTARVRFDGLGRLPSASADQAMDNQISVSARLMMLLKKNLSKSKTNALSDAEAEELLGIKRQATDQEWQHLLAMAKEERR